MPEHRDLPREQIMKMAEDTVNRIGPGATVHFKYTCEKCGTRQTFEDANVLYESGKCSECGHEQTVERAGFDLMFPLR